MIVKFHPIVVTHDGEDYLELQKIEVDVKARKYNLNIKNTLVLYF